jgi:hypothetical protein
VVVVDDVVVTAVALVGVSPLHAIDRVAPPTPSIPSASRRLRRFLFLLIVFLELSKAGLFRVRRGAAPG